MRLCIYIYFLFVTMPYSIVNLCAFDKKSIKSVLTYLLICTTSRQSIRGWLSSNTDVVPRYFAASSFFALLRVVVFGRVDTFSSVRLPLCSRY